MTTEFKTSAEKTEELSEALSILEMEPHGKFTAPCGCRGWITIMKDGSTEEYWGMVLSVACKKMVQLRPGETFDTGSSPNDSTAQSEDGIYWGFVYNHEELDCYDW